MVGKGWRQMRGPVRGASPRERSAFEQAGLRIDPGRIREDLEAGDVDLNQSNQEFNLSLRRIVRPPQGD